MAYILAVGLPRVDLAHLRLGAAHGLGIGLAFAAMANLVVQAVPAEVTGVATGVNTIMRSIGGAVGAQIAASMLASDTIVDGASRPRAATPTRSS